MSLGVFSTNFDASLINFSLLGFAAKDEISSKYLDWSNKIYYVIVSWY